MVKERSKDRSDLIHMTSDRSAFLRVSELGDLSVLGVAFSFQRFSGFVSIGKVPPDRGGQR